MVTSCTRLFILFLIIIHFCEIIGFGKYVRIANAFKCLYHYISFTFTFFVGKFCRLCLEGFIYDIELVFHTFAALGGKIHKFVCFFISNSSVGIQQLHHSGECLTDGQMVTL